jgi:hypothetical protein
MMELILRALNPRDAAHRIIELAKCVALKLRTKHGIELPCGARQN